MDFRDDAKLDSSQVEDRRGQGGGGISRGGLAIGGGGGIVTVIIIVAALLLGVDPTSIIQGGGTTGNPAGVQATQSGGTGGSVASCQTGADANQREDCRILGYVNSIQSYWNGEFTRRGLGYRTANTVFYTSATSGSGDVYMMIVPWQLAAPSLPPPCRCRATDRQLFAG